MKKRRKKSKSLLYGTILLVFSAALYLFSSLYLKQYNNQIAFEVQTAQRKIQVMSTEKEALQVEIDKLASKSIVMSLAKEDDMKFNKDSIIYINGKDE